MKIETIEKLKSVIRLLEEKKGDLLIFAIFLREEPLEKWDVLVAADWLNSVDMDAYKVVASNIQQTLDSSELVQFSRVVILDQDDPVVSFLLDLETIKNGGYKELNAGTLSEKFKFVIKRAYLLRSQKKIA